MNYSQASCLFFTFITKERNCCALSWIRARSFLLSSAEGRTLISWRNLSASLPINMGVFLIGLAIITRLNSNYAAKLLIYFQFTKQFPTFLRKSIITHHSSLITTLSSFVPVVLHPRPPCALIFHNFPRNFSIMITIINKIQSLSLVKLEFAVTANQRDLANFGSLVWRLYFLLNLFNFWYVVSFITGVLIAVMIFTWLFIIFIVSIILTQFIIRGQNYE